MLCQIYFLALHDNYYKARDMMLMSHLQETINAFDVTARFCLIELLFRLASAPSELVLSMRPKQPSKKSAEVAAKRSYLPKVS